MLLTTKQRSALRAKAHHLKPVVMIGQAGLTETVIEEIDRALVAHELIKIKVAAETSAQCREWAEQICQQIKAHPIQIIGKIIIVYRQNLLNTTA